MLNSNFIELHTRSRVEFDISPLSPLELMCFFPLFTLSLECVQVRHYFVGLSRAFVICSYARLPDKMQMLNEKAELVTVT